MARLTSRDQGRQHQDPRIAPLPLQQLDTDAALLVEEMRATGASPLTLVLTLAHCPTLLKQVNRMAAMFQNCSITPPDRELVVLNVAAFCRSEYLFAEHAPIAVQIGLAQDDLEHLWSRSLSPSWSTRQVGLITLSNDLLTNESLSDKAWSAVPFHEDPTPMIELITLIGFYRTIAGLTNALQMTASDFEHNQTISHPTKRIHE